ncbi:PPE family protein [Mycobacterium spongiae]|uniref:PPE domain-containing protein n=1 Tax=Mycobacterium spongiae TaxID=886343 RepID=A0A975PWU4_9MYCO|nr:PPE family protein [Mycobacterium spongiae]QUR67571.1 PPE domain-containing protein [Mycobacterium spongiae]
MLYAAFPPEINSGRIYMGPGAAPMLAAATAWEALAAELQATAAGYSSIVATLTSGPWVGPSSLAMAAAVAPYLTWMNATAEQAAEAGAQAAAAATAYEAAFAAHVPPAEVAANRAEEALLVATNIFGQNTPAIAAAEAQYAEMWVQDAIAMDTYTGASAAASRVTPFTEPPQVANGAGLVGQAAAAGVAAAAPAASLESLLTVGPISTLLQLGADIATGYTDAVTFILDSLIGTGATDAYLALYGALKAPSSVLAAFNDEGLLVNFPISHVLKYAPHPHGLGAIPRDALGGGLGVSPRFGLSSLFNAVSPGDVAADYGRGMLVGKMSVPPSWAAATPDIRTVAAALSATGPDAVSAAALGEGSLLSSASMAGMAGAAFGSAAPTALAGAGAKGRRTSMKDLKDGHSPEQLKRLVAQISEKPESVQHHSVDQEGLDSLLEQLSKKPGIHAVHLSKRDKVKVVPSDAQLG